MSARKNIGRGLVITVGNVVVAIGSFARNVLIARFVSVEDFGIASTLAMTMSVVELSSDVGLDRLIVQAQDGNEPRLQACTHSFQMFRGLVTALILFLVARPMAALFGIVHVEWAFQCVALVPLVRSFTHLDFARLQRDFQFAPAAWVDAIPPIITTLATIPLAMMFGDYRVMLTVLILQAVLHTIVSHVVAQRRYTLGYDADLIRRIVAFGWPLSINGLLIFAALHGDRAIVAISFSIRDLGWYAPCLSLMLVPSMIISRVLRSALLPMLSRAQADPFVFRSQLQLGAEAVLCSATAFCLFGILSGSTVLLNTFGNDYREGVAFIPLMALTNAVRILRVGPIMAAMSLGETKNAPVGNIVRLISIPCGIGSVHFGWGIQGVVASILVGELLAFMTSLVVFARWCKQPYPILVQPMLAFIASVCGAYWLSTQISTGTNLLGESLLALVGTVVGIALVVVSCPSLSAWLMTCRRPQVSPLK